MMYQYAGQLYPDYLKEGGASRFIAPVAAHFCRGRGLDIGCGRWPIDGAEPIDIQDGADAMALPDGPYDYLFSSHCLEHLSNPVAALEHWQSRLKPGGVLFLYLPHPAMRYWRPQFCRKHLHQWWPADMADLLRDIGFVNVIHSERDMAWSFCAVGFMPADVSDIPRVKVSAIMVDNAHRLYR